MNKLRRKLAHISPHKKVHIHPEGVLIMNQSFEDILIEIFGKKEIRSAKRKIYYGWDKLVRVWLLKKYRKIERKFLSRIIIASILDLAVISWLLMGSPFSLLNQPMTTPQSISVPSSSDSPLKPSFNKDLVFQPGRLIPSSLSAGAGTSDENNPEISNAVLLPQEEQCAEYKEEEQCSDECTNFEIKEPKKTNYRLAPPRKNPPERKIAAPRPATFMVVAGRRVCNKKNDKPGKSKQGKGKHMDMECCLDPDEIPNPHCYYSPEKYGKYL